MPTKRRQYTYEHYLFHGDGSGYSRAGYESKAAALADMQRWVAKCPGVAHVVLRQPGQTPIAFHHPQLRSKERT